MNVLIDTPIWSTVLRRPAHLENAAIQERVAALADDEQIAIIGPIRQEALSGIREPAQFERLRDYLRDFTDTEITTGDYEQAASFYNICRAHGIQGSQTDFLICAVAARHEFAIFTTDADFTHYAKILPITLYS